jgi:Protein of unknown function (DUF664)
VISVEDYLVYVDDAVDGMVDIVTGLGDELANRRPDLPGANSAYALLTHCLGVMEFWGGQAVAGRTIERDRDAEFVATGPVDELVAKARGAQQQLRTDIVGVDLAEPPTDGSVLPEDAGHPLARSKGAVLIHIYEELAQHRGQMEIGRDVVVRAAG